MHRSKSRVSKISQLRTERYQPPKTLVLPRSNAWKRVGDTELHARQPILFGRDARHGWIPD